MKCHIHFTFSRLQLCSRECRSAARLPDSLLLRWFLFSDRWDGEGLFCRYMAHRGPMFAIKFAIILPFCSRNAQSGNHAATLPLPLALVWLSRKFRHYTKVSKKKDGDKHGWGKWGTQHGLFINQVMSLFFWFNQCKLQGGNSIEKFSWLMFLFTFD